MKMSDTICVPKSEPGFITNCRLCLNESSFPTVSIFDEEFKNEDLARKIMLLTNIVITPPHHSGSHTDELDSEPSRPAPPTSICMKCKNKVDAFLWWKENAWSLQKRFKAPGSSTHHLRHTRHQDMKSEKLPLLRGHRSSNDSCIDEDYDSLLASPCSSGPDSPHHPHHSHSHGGGSSIPSGLDSPHHSHAHGGSNPSAPESPRHFHPHENHSHAHENHSHPHENHSHAHGNSNAHQSHPHESHSHAHGNSNGLHSHPNERVAHHEDESSQDGGGSSTSVEESEAHHHLLMEPVVKIEEESVEYNSAGTGDYGEGEVDPDSTELVIDENRLRHEQSRIQLFLNRGGANSILRSLISSELPRIRPGSSEAAVLTNRTNLPISPALPPFKLDDSNKDRTSNVASYRRKQKHPTRTGHESEDQDDDNASCALRSLPDEVLSQKLPVPSCSSSSSVHTSTVIINPSSSTSTNHPRQSPSPTQQQHVHQHSSPKKARKSMYPFNYLLEAIDFTSRQSSPENTSDLVLGATSVITTSTSCDEKESSPRQEDVPMEEPKQEVVYPHEDNDEDDEDNPTDPEALEEMRRDLQELQRQQQKQREQDQLIIAQHLRETIAGVASRTQDSGSEDHHHDYSSPRSHLGQPSVFSVKLSTNHLPTSLTNGYYPGPDLKSATEISLKNLLASHQAPGPAPTILKKARVRASNHSNAGNHNNSSPNSYSGGALSLKLMTSSPRGADSPSPSPSPSPLCMSPSPSPHPLPLPLPSNTTSEAESPRGSPKIRFTPSQSPYPNLQIGQILPKRHDLACTNCNTKVTTIWRRYPSGEMVCNACGLYYRLHCRPRPVSMRRDNIHPRKRRPKNSGPGSNAAGGKRECSPDKDDEADYYGDGPSPAELFSSGHKRAAYSPPVSTYSPTTSWRRKSSSPSPGGAYSPRNGAYSPSPSSGPYSPGYCAEETVVSSSSSGRERYLILDQGIAAGHC